jgi:hypothetical protein
MPSITKASAEWAERHGECGEDHLWRCRTTGQPLRIAYRPRSIWIRPFTGGFGEVRLVGHVFCSACQRDPQFPEPGLPIYEDELVEVS